MSDILNADGNGYSLVLIAPLSDPPHGDPFSWRPSVGTGGTPGTSDAAPAFSGAPDVDSDGDELTAFFEHATGTSDAIPNPNAAPSIGHAFFDDGTGNQREYLTVIFLRNLAADDVVFETQLSSDLENWSSLETTFVSAANNGDVLQRDSPLVRLTDPGFPQTATPAAPTAQAWPLPRPSDKPRRRCEPLHGQWSPRAPLLQRDSPLVRLDQYPPRSRDGIGGHQGGANRETCHHQLRCPPHRYRRGCRM